METLRYWINLCETAAPLELPAKAQAVLNKPSKVKLKNGEIAVLTLTIYRPDIGGVTIDATINGENAGFVNLCQNKLPPPDDDYDLYAEDRGSWSASNVWVNKEFTRRGLATAMYDFATSLGFKILRSGIHSGKLSPNGQDLWQSNRAPLRLGKPMPKQSRFWKIRKHSA